MTDQRLLALAHGLGIEDHYWDIWGHRHEVGEEAMMAIVESMGFDGANWQESLFRLEEEKRRVLPLTVARQGQNTVIARLQAPSAITFVVERESGERIEGRIEEKDLRFEGEAEGAKCFALDIPFALGYHRLSLFSGKDHLLSQSALIDAPPACWMPEGENNRWWGLALQLYAIKSSGNWGMGDFDDLEQLVRLAAQEGAATIGLNPLHALFPHHVDSRSPYSPLSRLFLDPFYLRPSGHLDTENLKASEKVEWQKVLASKTQALKDEFKSFCHDPQGQEGKAFAAFFSLGKARDFAVFMALWEHFREKDADLWGWPVWPQAYRLPRSREVQEFLQAHEDQVKFWAYLQWRAQEKLDSVAKEAKSKMPLGLYLDLAVGSPHESFDCWQDPGAYVMGASIGAPPDDFNPEGQEWGLAPFNPHALAERGFAPLAEVFSATMRFCGAMRLDHAMQLARLFWVPRGKPPMEGAYVHYPLKEMAAVLALESARAQCLVIDEDLGTVPEGFREAMARLHALSYQPLYFVRHWQEDGSFLLPEEYPKLACVVTSTHDLPPLAAFWKAQDIAFREKENNRHPHQDFSEEKEERERIKRLLLEALGKAYALPNGPDAWQSDFGLELAKAIFRFGARSRSMGFLPPLEDFLGLMQQVNMPGLKLHPNWCQKIPVPLEELASHPWWVAIVALLREERPG